MSYRDFNKADLFPVQFSAPPLMLFTFRYHHGVVEEDEKLVLRHFVPFYRATAAYQQHIFSAHTH